MKDIVMKPLYNLLKFFVEKDTFGFYLSSSVV
jgi:hypothetical protein